jgi:hypothetical protein
MEELKEAYMKIDNKQEKELVSRGRRVRMSSHGVGPGRGADQLRESFYLISQSNGGLADGESNAWLKETLVLLG